MNKVFIKTMGCRLNKYDSDTLGGILISLGYEIVKDVSICDYFILNTCTVTNNADRKCKHVLRSIKKNNKNVITIVIGCGVQIDNDYVLKDYVDHVTKNNLEVIDILKNYTKLNKKISNNKVFVSLKRAMLKIQNGCDNYCSYCIIPFTRGSSCNVSQDKILDDINRVTNAGIKEIVITGINIGAYGATKTTHTKESRFADLLQIILSKTKIPRIRLSSLGPEFFNEELYQIFMNPRICNHVHLSIQSGSNKILSKMNRRYDISKIEEIVTRLRKIEPNIAFSSDVIVGFPGETEKDFDDTVQFIKKIELSKIHVFPYSNRQGTLASKMENQVDTIIKIKRSKELRAINEKLNKKFIQKNIGYKSSVLWESVNKTLIKGLTRNYLEIAIDKVDRGINIIEEIVLSNENMLIRMGGI